MWISYSLFKPGYITVTVLSQVLMLLVFSLLLTLSYGDVDLCLKCTCFQKALIQPLYTVGCSHLSLQHTFPDLEKWPEYAQQQETRMAVNFDWNNIRHLKKFPHLPGIVSLSLQNNEMSKIAGSAFVELDNLKALDLSFNQLTGNLNLNDTVTLFSDFLISTPNVYVHSAIL
jgi:hypothetical protein